VASIVALGAVQLYFIVSPRLSRAIAFGWR